MHADFVSIKRPQNKVCYEFLFSPRAAENI